MCNRLVWILFLSGVLLYPLSVGGQTQTVPSDEFSSGGATSRGCACVEEKQACYQLQNVQDAEKRGQKPSQECWDLTNRALEVERQMCKLHEKYIPSQSGTGEEVIAQEREYRRNYFKLQSQRTDKLDQAMKACPPNPPPTPISGNTEQRMSSGSVLVNSPPDSMDYSVYPPRPIKAVIPINIRIPMETLEMTYKSGKDQPMTIKLAPPPTGPYVFKQVKGFVHSDGAILYSFYITDITGFSGNTYNQSNPLPNTQFPIKVNLPYEPPG